MTYKEFKESVQRDINYLINKEEEQRPKTMVEFLNKHAKDNNTILYYWYGEELQGLTDAEILNKCIFLDLEKCDILETIFGFEKFEEFVDDYEELAKKLGYEFDYKRGRVWKK